MVYELTQLHTMQGNVLIDGENNARLTDFGLSQLLLPGDDGSSYLRTMSINPGAVMWTAPELVYPKLYPKWSKDGKPMATLNSDIYTFGNMILFVCLAMVHEVTQQVAHPWFNRADTLREDALAGCTDSLETTEET